MMYGAFVVRRRLGLLSSPQCAYLVEMVPHDDFRPPDHLPPFKRFLYRAFCIAFFAVGMTLFIYFVAPLIYRHVSIPFGEWTYEQVRQWTGEPPLPPRT
jgi:hypothetical protein